MRGGGERARSLTDSQLQWLEIRSFLLEHRYDLAVSAAEGYPAENRIAGTPLLADPGWLPDPPLDLADIELAILAGDSADASTAHVADAATELALPVRPDGSRYESYSAAVADLSPPTTFENRPTYRLLEAGLNTLASHMVFSRGHYFDGLNFGEACAHEYAASILNGTPRPLRDAIGTPWDLSRRPANMAISTLTLRVDKTAHEASFLLHRRDATKVGHAGGLYQVLPVGIFQPSGRAAWNEQNDFDLWRNITREYAEELLGTSEDHGSEHAPINYAAWPFSERLSTARRHGMVRAHVLGMGADPLTLATDLLTVVAVHASAFDEIFGDLVDSNSEGQLVASADQGVAFTRENVHRFARYEPIQAAGAALLELAWANQAILLT